MTEFVYSNLDQNKLVMELNWSRETNHHETKQTSCSVEGERMEHARAKSVLCRCQLINKKGRPRSRLKDILCLTWCFSTFGMCSLL